MDIQSDLRTIPIVFTIVNFILIYARFVSSRLRPGLLRFLSLLPVISLLPFIPFLFSTIHFRTNSGFFLAWLCLFKLLLLAFGGGPLDPSLSLISFVSLASLPIKLRTQTKTTDRKDQNSSPNFKSPIYLLSTAIKAVLFGCLLSLYRYKNQMHPYTLYLVQSFHIYLSLEVMLATAAILAGLLLNMELEPQFNKPYFSTSLRDFWGRRWNLMVSAILRPSVYEPVRSCLGRGTATIATFAISGIMHELMFYYITLIPPSGVAMFFFLLHGVCTAIEGWWAEHEKWWRPPKVLGMIGTIAFVSGTSFLFFFPAMLRGDALEKGLLEIEAMMGLFTGA